MSASREYKHIAGGSYEQYLHVDGRLFTGYARNERGLMRCWIRGALAAEPEGDGVFHIGPVDDGPPIWANMVDDPDIPDKYRMGGVAMYRAMRDSYRAVYRQKMRDDHAARFVLENEEYIKYGCKNETEFQSKKAAALDEYLSQPELVAEREAYADAVTGGRELDSRYDHLLPDEWLWTIERWVSKDG